MLEIRIKTFHNILSLLEKNSNAMLYSLKIKTSGSLYDGDYGLVKVFEDDICCLLGLKEIETINNITNCAPQSWMASNRPNKLIYGKKPIFMNQIIKIPVEVYKPDIIFTTN